jgi:hypothetical protein
MPIRTWAKPCTHHRLPVTNPQSPCGAAIHSSSISHASSSLPSSPVGFAHPNGCLVNTAAQRRTDSPHPHSVESVPLAADAFMPGWDLSGTSLAMLRCSPIFDMIRYPPAATTTTPPWAPCQRLFGSAAVHVTSIFCQHGALDRPRHLDSPLWCRSRPGLVAWAWISGHLFPFLTPSFLRPGPWDAPSNRWSAPARPLGSPGVAHFGPSTWIHHEMLHADGVFRLRAI